MREEALTELAPGRDKVDGLTVVEAWPYLIVANSVQVRVIDADSTVLTHDLRVPSGHSYRYGFHFVDGALLVFWSTYGHGSEAQAYWHTAPDKVFTVDGGAGLLVSPLGAPQPAAARRWAHHRRWSPAPRRHAGPQGASGALRRHLVLGVGRG